MKSRFAIVILLFAAAAAQAQEAAKPKPEALAQRVFDVAAGPAWDAARYFAFTFVLDRDGKPVASFPQRYDRVSGDYRVSGLDPKGKKFEVVMNLNAKKGRAWLEGVELTGNAAAPILAFGLQRYQNDIFWLMMPFKMHEAGVKLTYGGTRDDACGHTWDVIQPAFDASFGFSPSDEYAAWVNRDTGLVDSWDMKLANVKDSVAVNFRDYQRVGGLLVSLRRDITAKKQTVRLEGLQVLPEPPKGAFQ